MVRHTQTIRRLLPTICLSVFDHFVRLRFKSLKSPLDQIAFVTEAHLGPFKTSMMKRFLEAVNGFQVFNKTDSPLGAKYIYV